MEEMQKKILLLFLNLNCWKHLDFFSVIKSAFELEIRGIFSLCLCLFW